VLTTVYLLCVVIEGGKMSQHLNDLKIGDTILMKGPKGHLEYLDKGSFTITKRGETTTYRKKKIGMIAGGTGITPMLQVIRAIQKNPDDRTEVWLIFANQTEEDILLRKELEALPSGRFHLHYTLDRPPADWKYSSGFINTEMCRKHLPAPSDDSMIFVCGPPPMIKFACEPAFKEIGITEEHWFSF
jgi:cytochrome-b5 reductase